MDLLDEIEEINKNILSLDKSNVFIILLCVKKNLLSFLSKIKKLITNKIIEILLGILIMYLLKKILNTYELLIISLILPYLKNNMFSENKINKQTNTDENDNN